MKNSFPAAEAEEGEGLKTLSTTSTNENKVRKLVLKIRFHYSFSKVLAAYAKRRDTNLKIQEEHSIHHSSRHVVFSFYDAESELIKSRLMSCEIKLDVYYNLHDV